MFVVLHGISFVAVIAALLMEIIDQLTLYCTSVLYLQ